MKKLILLIAVLLMGVLGIQARTRSSAIANDVDAKAAFERLSSLAGEWEADSSMGKSHITYELIAGGSTLVERETMDHMPPMETMYHIDGKRLLLTHYCAAGNQPRMQATLFRPTSGDLQFEFIDATGMASASDGHMHNARFRLVDRNHFSSEWDFYENGQKRSTESFHFVRIR